MATQVVYTKSKLVPKDLGNPKTAAALPDGNNSIVTLGTIFGRATGTKAKTFTDRATGEQVTADAIVGTFVGRRAVPLENGDGTETVEIRSGFLYLPNGIAELLTVPLSMTDRPEMIEFAIRIGTRKASNPAGYEYVVSELHKPQGAADPLQHLRLLVEPVAAIEDQSKKTIEEKPVEEKAPHHVKK